MLIVSIWGYIMTNWLSKGGFETCSSAGAVQLFNGIAHCSLIKFEGRAFHDS